MSYSEDIDKALYAHALWRRRLNEAITTGHSDFEAAKVKKDDLCDFGKWFYSLPVDIQSSEQGQAIRKQHIEFHAEAARILGLAINGKSGEAAKDILPGSKFISLSGRLAMALTTWKSSLDPR